MLSVLVWSGMAVIMGGGIGVLYHTYLYIGAWHFVLFSISLTRRILCIDGAGCTYFFLPSLMAFRGVWIGHEHG